MRFPWRRQKVEQRQIQWPFNVGPPAFGGVSTDDQALALAAVFASVRLLADSVSSLPLKVYRDTGGRRVRVRTSSLFDQPSSYGTQYDWVYQCMTSLLLHGNAYGLVTSRDGFGFPTNIEWLRTEFVAVEEDANYNALRAKFYYLGRELLREDLLHVRAFTRAGHVKGLSPIATFAETIGSGLAARDYGNQWFANGGVPPGTFKNTAKTVSPEAAEEVSQRLAASMQRGRPLVYGEDWEYNPVAVPPEEAQFLSSMKLTATQIAAIYDVPAERVGGEPGGSLTYSTQEQDQIRLALTTQRWCTRLEHAFFGLLPERQYVRFNVDAMIRTDTLTRHQVYKLDREIGFKNIDELRDQDDLEPLPDGEGTDYSPLAAIVAEAKPEPAAPAPVSDPAPPTSLPARPRAVS